MQVPPTADARIIRIIKVLVVAGDSLARAGLASLLADQAGMAVAGQVAFSERLADDAGLYQPDVIVWDMGWEPSPALEALPDVVEAGVPVLALLPDATQAAEAWTAGARGALARSASLPALRAGVQALAQGLAAFEPDFVPAAQVRMAQPFGTGAPAASLTPRELEVLRALAEGLSNKSIAYKLDISEHTVKFHVNSIMGKLGAQSRTEAVVLATRLGLVPL